MDTRIYPITPEYFEDTVQPLIEGSYIWKGRPPTIGHYQVFCAILYVLRTGVPWRDRRPVMATGTASTRGSSAAANAGCGGIF